MLPAADLDRVVEHSAPHFERLRGATVLITGATGFFGRWMLESLMWANRQLSLDLRCIAHGSARSAGSAQPRFDGTVDWVFGEVEALPHLLIQAGYAPESLGAIVHLAVSAGTADGRPRPLGAFTDAVQGAHAVLEMARRARGCRVLITSSGAVYGRQASVHQAHSEDLLPMADPLDVADGYGAAKRAIEFLAAASVAEHGTEAVIARPFAFIGPRLPFDRNFAAGNFLRDALRGTPIVIDSDGSAVRSYLYASDLADWLWAVLAAGRPGRAYNVGSATPVSILGLANAIAAECGVPVIVNGRPVNEARPAYVPDVARIVTELGVRERVDLPEAIRRTMAWAAQPPGGHTSRHVS